MTVAGVDEAGRGPIAGPVVAAAAVLTPPQFRVLLSEGLNDSKKLSAPKRERLFARMGELGVVWAAQAASNVRIDSTNILASTLWAMGRAVRRIGLPLDLVVVDGSSYIPDIPRALQRVVPKADARVPSVMAASVIAKVLRDRAMTALHRFFPEYGFDKHKGYPTAFHRRMVDMLGPSRVHRLSFVCCKHVTMEMSGKDGPRQTVLFDDK
ncbi:MAG: ribonuclease HII [Synergistaceae bacterium]|nr:ribonuclease HII [Synergistaceae bacterium]